MKNTLLLNSDYMPIKVISWQRAVCLWFTDKVEIVEEYNDFDLRSVSFTMKCPAVVRLLNYVKAFRKTVKFSRINIFHRDNFTCQYCGVQPGIKELTFEHIVPRSRGGKTTWENIVTACYPCNVKKGSKTLREAKMRLLSVPKEPKASDPAFLRIRFDFPKTPDAWRSYLYWHQKLEKN